MHNEDPGNLPESHLCYGGAEPIWRADGVCLPADRKVRLDRAPLRKNGRPGLDITVKSAIGIARFFAPTWDMVRSHKSGLINDDIYTMLYEARLDRLSDEVIDWIYSEGCANGGELTLLCYCQDNKFCHTHVLMEYLVRQFPDCFVRKLQK